jgi:hypothetical protein
MTFKFYIVVILCFFSSDLYSASDLSKYDPIDHHGEDLIIEENTTLYGEHININNFHVATSTTLSILPYDPLVTYSGRLVIHANAIDVKGAIDASGAGYTGGGGGRGSGGRGNEYESVPGYGRYAGFEAENEIGSFGDGKAAGEKNGGYNISSYNTDQTVDDSLLMGSGGKGGNGGLTYIYNDGYGLGASAGGGAGGGYVKLFAEKQLIIFGKVVTKGMLGESGGDADASIGFCFTLDMLPGNITIYVPGIGGAGGNAWPPGEGLGGEGDDNIECDSYAHNGEAGGSGAGGGVLLKCNTVNGMELTGEINTLGGSSEDPTQNGGTLKVFSPSPVSLDNCDIHIGRLYVEDSLKQVGWELY